LHDPTELPHHICAHVILHILMDIHVCIYNKTCYGQSVGRVGWKEQLSNLKTTTTLTNKISLSWLKTSDDHESVLRNEKITGFLLTQGNGGFSFSTLR